MGRGTGCVNKEGWLLLPRLPAYIIAPVAILCAAKCYEHASPISPTGDIVQVAQCKLPRSECVCNPALGVERPCVFLCVCVFFVLVWDDPLEGHYRLFTLIQILCGNEVYNFWMNLIFWFGDPNTGIADPVVLEEIHWQGVSWVLFLALASLVHKVLRFVSKIKNQNDQKSKQMFRDVPDVPSCDKFWRDVEDWRPVKHEYDIELNKRICHLLWWGDGDIMSSVSIQESKT